MTEGPLLWYLNRSTGVVALVLLTVTTVLGALSVGGRPGGRLPRFVTQSVHRNVALLSTAFLVAHAVSAVVDEFVDLRWWDALVPFVATYQPLWTGLGALALDLVVVVTVSSLLRRRMRRRGWWLLHLTTYLLWATAMAHGIGMGTDLGDRLWLLTVACAAAVPMALAWRLAWAAVHRLHRVGPEESQATDAMTMPIRRIP